MIYDTTSNTGMVSLIQRRWRLMSLTCGIVLATGIAGLSVLPKTYESTAKLLVMRTEQRFSGLEILQNALPELTGSSQPLNTQVELIRLRPVLHDVIHQLDLKDANGQPLLAEDLAARILVTPIKGTDLIEITYRDSDPQRTQQVVAALCEVYLQNTDTNRRGGVEQGLKFVDEQLATAQARLNDAESRLQKYKQTSGSISLNDEIQASVRDLSELNTLIRSRKLEVESLKARAKSMRSKLRMAPQDALEAATLAQNPRLKSLQDQLVAAETSPLRNQGLAPDHPDLVALNHRIAMLKDEVQTEIRNLLGRKGSLRTLNDIQVGLLRDLTSTETELMAAQAGLTAAEKSRMVLSAAMAQLPGHEITLDRLEREVTVTSQIYQDLLQKREQARLNLSIAPSFAQVVQAPVIPARPLIPLGGQAGSVLVLTSLAMGFGAGALRDLFDRRVAPQALASSLPELKIVSTLPVLSKAELKGGELVVKTGASPSYEQAISTLGLALEEQLDGVNGRVIAMTSSSPEEGKSVTLANLATSLTEMGHRVLLVDADLRRPRAHAILGDATPGTGLSELLLERATPGAVIRSMGGVDLVTAGSTKVPFKLAKLKARLKPLLDAWRPNYDFILVDLPPLAMVAEVAHVAKQSDGLLFLGNFQRVTPEALFSGVQLLRAVKIPILGAVSITTPSHSPDAKYYLIAGEGSRV